MKNFINLYLQHSIMRKEEKTSLQLLTVILIILSDVFIQVISSVTQREISCKNVMRNILFLNPIKEAPKQELEEICMQSFLLENQQMDPEEILLLEILENLYKLIDMDLFTKMEKLKLTNLQSIAELLPELHFTFLSATKTVQIKIIYQKSVFNG